MRILEPKSLWSGIKINRCLKPDNFGTIKTAEFNNFFDASSTGYGQCSYLRLVDNENKVHCSLLMAKSRVEPLKSIIVPGL